MSDLPAIKYLDKAAKNGKLSDWANVKAMRSDCSDVYISIVAHARTLEEADRLREVLAKYEPEPVDGDEAALLRIVNAWMGSERTLDLRREGYTSDWANALAQYKAERPTITDDEALLIAREICAREAGGRGSFEDAHRYRDGAYDNDPEVQFALAMVKRDPAALEAFRGVGRG